jgi:hypothetical protein
MTEAALCVVQSGNEFAPTVMLKARLKDCYNPVAKLIQKAREQHPLANESEKKVLNNLLTAFYIKPASGDKGGSVEFTHKSFGEFLFAERLVESFLDWTRKVERRRREEDDVSTEAMDKQIYDLLGYGSLTPEIVNYLRGLWAENSELDLVRLFERLEHFYLRWCDGEFIDPPPEKENLPLFKKEQLRKQLPERETHLGLRQVDVYAGSNVMIVLLELHRYAQTKDELKDKITFRPCGQPDTKEFDRERLLRIIGYGRCLGAYAYKKIAKVFFSGVFLSQADLSQANLSQANLSRANLSRANLSRADLSQADLSQADLSRANFSQADLVLADLNGVDLRGANLSQADLRGANLSQADLSQANLSRADLRGADLRGADLRGADLNAIQWDSETKWANATGLHEAIGVS